MRKAIAVLIFATPLYVVGPCEIEALAHTRGETKLAGLRPGKDTIESADRRFEKGNVNKFLADDSSSSWRDSCNYQELAVTVTPAGIIQSVAVHPATVSIDADCGLDQYSRKARARFGSGRGLAFRDRCERIKEVYGEPRSLSSEESRNEKFEFYLYTSDQTTAIRLTWQVTCNASVNQVTEMKLAVADH